MHDYAVTAANVHDSQAFDEIIDPDNEDLEVCADSTYRSEETEAALEEACYVSRIQEKGQAWQTLAEEQNRHNRKRFRVRSRVEHVFGVQENGQGGKLVRTIGLSRAKLKIGLMNFSYNLCRYVHLRCRGVSVPADA